VREERKKKWLIPRNIGRRVCVPLLSMTILRFGCDFLIKISSGVKNTLPFACSGCSGCCQTQVQLGVRVFAFLSFQKDICNTLSMTICQKTDFTIDERNLALSARIRLLNTFPRVAADARTISLGCRFNCCCLATYLLTFHHDEDWSAPPLVVAFGNECLYISQVRSKVLIALSTALV